MGRVSAPEDQGGGLRLPDAPATSLAPAPRPRYTATTPHEIGLQLMRQSAGILRVQTRRQGLVEITSDVLAWIQSTEVGADTGLLTLFSRHTSASLVIQENASPDARADLEDFFAVVAPEDAGRYRHDQEGPDDMPAHIRASLTGVSLSIPILGGRPALGTWQGIYLFEHRRRPHLREIALHLMGD